MINYIQTYTGKKVHLPDTDPESIDIRDIAHALSNACRFAGHTRSHYSVAAHSICVADIVPRQHKLQALLHDATEAYLTDVPTPYKLLMPEYLALEESLWRAIAIKFGLPEELHPSVKEADRVMLMTERDLLCTTDKDWGDFMESTLRVPHLVEYNIDVAPEHIEKEFIRVYEEYSTIT